MANKPSERTHRIKPDESLNLTPLIDMVTCLMFFLLIYAGIIPVAIIDAPLPKIASTAEEVKKAKEDKNQLDLMVDITPTSIVVRDGGGSRVFQSKPEAPADFKEFHDYLVTLKARKPKSQEITISPSDAVTYERIIGVMDAARELVKGDTGFQELPPGTDGTPEAANHNRLFPDVSLGGV